MFKTLKNLLSRKRVLEVNGLFIPQVLTPLGWAGVDKINGHKNEWLVFDMQLKHCTVNSLEEARTDLQDYCASVARERARVKANKVAHCARLADAKKRLQRSNKKVHGA
jgi:hypothetical protein